MSIFHGNRTFPYWTFPYRTIPYRTIPYRTFAYPDFCLPGHFPTFILENANKTIKKYINILLNIYTSSTIESSSDLITIDTLSAVFSTILHVVRNFSINIQLLLESYDFNLQNFKCNMFKIICTIRLDNGFCRYLNSS